MVWLLRDFDVVWLLRDFDVEDETVMMAPAEGFYAPEGLGKDEVRLSYVLNEKDLQKSMEIIKKGLEVYRAKNKKNLFRLEEVVTSSFFYFLLVFLS